MSTLVLVPTVYNDHFTGAAWSSTPAPPPFDHLKSVDGRTLESFINFGGGNSSGMGGINWVDESTGAAFNWNSVITNNIQLWLSAQVPGNSGQVVLDLYVNSDLNPAINVNYGPLVTLTFPTGAQGWVKTFDAPIGNTTAQFIDTLLRAGHFEHSLIHSIGGFPVFSQYIWDATKVVVDYTPPPQYIATEV